MIVFTSSKIVSFPYQNQLVFISSDESLSSAGSLSPTSSTNSLDGSHAKQGGKDVFFQVKQESERRKLVIDVMNEKMEQVHKTS